MYLDGQLNKAQLPAWMQVTKLSGHWFIQKMLAGVNKLAKFIYTFYMAIVVFITLLPVYIIVRLSSQDFAAKVTRLWAQFLQIAAFSPLVVVGRPHLKQTSPVIYACNHASYVDSVVLLALLPPGTRFIGKKELFSVPIIRTFMRKLGFLPVDRIDLSKGLEDTKNIERSLKSGNSILIFPEGTFGYSSGLRPFRLGAFKVAAETNTSICPIALQGTRSLLRDDEKLLRPNRIKVTVCEPIKPKGTEWQDVTELRNAVRAKIAEYCGEPSLDFIAAQIVAPKPPRTA